MEAPTASNGPVRLLGLGNEILSDDAFGILAAREAERRYGSALEVLYSSSAGFALLDDVLGAARLLVVDTMATGSAPPGTIRVVSEDQVLPAAGCLPHGLGLFEVLALGRKLGLAVPWETVVIGVEPSDCITVGGGIHPDVAAAMPKVLEMVGEFLKGGFTWLTRERSGWC